MTVPFIRKSTQATHHGRETSLFTPKAEYICADLSIALRFSLAVAGLAETIPFTPPPDEVCVVKLTPPSSHQSPP